MGLQTFKAGVTLHTAGSDRADTLEILVRGRIQIDNGIVTLNAGTGAILGLAETPGAPYRFTYTAMEDAQIISYAYLSTDDIAAMIVANAKICPILASECVRLACEALNVRAQKYSQVQTAYDNILSGYTEYPALCEQVGEYPASFEVMKNLQPPVMSGNIAPWEENYLRALMEHADEVRTGCYAVSPEIASGIILSTMKFYDAVAEACIAVYAYEEQLREDTAPFTSAIQLLRARIVEREHSEALGTEGGDAPAIENALDTILSYAAADPKVTEEFRSSLMSFRENPNRYATTDEA
ncbi:MAG: hypothetical protein II868_05160, partial [Butyrivibrio sp.]|nr:hypothetical protein [Butyrivibrio sp.]